MTQDAFVGIDVAFAKGKRLPIVVCKREDTRLIPLMLRSFREAIPPLGRGNRIALDPQAVRDFATDTLSYLRIVERAYDLRIRRIAIDAPSSFKREGLARRAAEVAMDQRQISCFATPSQVEFEVIKAKAATHLNIGGEENRLPHANQLWMLVGFALFEVLGQHYECIEVFPQAIAATLRSNKVHKSQAEGLSAQLIGIRRLSGWPSDDRHDELEGIAFGSRHDKLDAYMSSWVASLSKRESFACGEEPSDVIWIPHPKRENG